MYSTYLVQPPNHNAELSLCSDVLFDFLLIMADCRLLIKVDTQNKMRVFIGVCIKAFLLVLLEGDKPDFGRQCYRCHLSSRSKYDVFGYLVV